MQKRKNSGFLPYPQPLETLEFGYPNAQYLRIGGLTLIFVALIIAGFWGAIFAAGSHLWTLAALIAAGTLILATLLLFQALRLISFDRADRILQFDEAFSYSSGRTTVAVRWDEIEAIHYKIRLHLARHTGHTLLFQDKIILPIHIDALRVSRKDGLNLVLDPAFTGISMFLNTLKLKSAEHLFPPLLDQLTAGNVLQFGPLHISQDGIQTTRRHYSWSEVTAISFGFGKVLYFKLFDGWRYCEQIRLIDIPNPHILMMLLARFTQVIDFDKFVFDAKTLEDFRKAYYRYPRTILRASTNSSMMIPEILRHAGYMSDFGLEAVPEAMV